MRDDDKRTAHDLGGGSAKIIPLRPSPAGSAGQLAGHLRRLALEASANLVELVATADQYGVEVPAHVRRAAAALEGASPGADAMAGQQAMNRRQVLGGAAAVAGALVLGQRTAALQGLRRAAGDEATQRVVSALKRPGKVDAITVADMEAATAAYRRGYRQLSVRTLLPQAEGQVQVVEELLGGSMKPTLRKRLTATAAEAHALVGVMLLMDLYTFDAAWWQLSEALSAAREAQAGELEAFVLGAMAFNAGYAGRRAEAIDLITEARTIARAADGPRTRGWLAAVESELRARTGDARASLAALADAESALQVWTSMMANHGLGWGRSTQPSSRATTASATFSCSSRSRRLASLPPLSTR
jgi:hypothetical protein